MSKTTIATTTCSTFDEKELINPIPTSEEGIISLSNIDITQSKDITQTSYTKLDYEILLVERERISAEKKATEAREAENLRLIALYETEQQKKVLAANEIISNRNFDEGKTLALIISASTQMLANFDESRRKLDAEELERKQQLAVAETLKPVTHQQFHLANLERQIAINKAEEERLSAAIRDAKIQADFDHVTETLATMAPEQLKRTLELLLIRLNKLQRNEV